MDPIQFRTTPLSDVEVQNSTSSSPTPPYPFRPHPAAGSLFSFLARVLSKHPSFAATSSPSHQQPFLTLFFTPTPGRLLASSRLLWLPSPTAVRQITLFNFLAVFISHSRLIHILYRWILEWRWGQKEWARIYQSSLPILYYESESFYMPKKTLNP